MGRPAKAPQPDYGRHLSSLRKAAGLSQAQLADKLDVRQSTVASWEHSANPPKGSILPDLAAALGVSLDVLLGASSANGSKHRGPSSKLDSLVEQVRQLPKRRQQRITNTLEALLTQESAS